MDTHGHDISKTDSYMLKLACGKKWRKSRIRNKSLLRNWEKRERWKAKKNDQPDDIKGARFHTGWNETVAPITGGKLAFDLRFLDQSSISGAHPQLQNRRQLFASFSENAKVQVWRSWYNSTLSTWSRVEQSCAVLEKYILTREENPSYFRLKYPPQIESKFI